MQWKVLRHRYPVVIVGTAGYGAPIESRLSALAREGVITWMGHVHDQQLLSVLWANAGCYFHGHSVGARTRRSSRPWVRGLLSWRSTNSGVQP